MKLIYDQNEETELAPDLYVRARTPISNFSSIKNCSFFYYQILFFYFIDEIMIIWYYGIIGLIRINAVLYFISIFTVNLGFIIVYIVISVFLIYITYSSTHTYMHKHTHLTPGH